ncbi:MAG TPA: septum site-determining protein MinC [Anaerolineae bacterium]|nr:septum site-determining protein MinC [Anaerolineae bacterium]HQK13284.1 septum site-determining protein MinC [Anaerolineae bacterium]
MALTIKGTQQGILLRPLSASWADVLQALDNALRDAETFFRGGRVILDMGTQELTRENLGMLRDVLDRYDMELWAVLSENEDTVRTARSFGLRTRLPGEATPKEQPTPALPEANALVVQRTLRSGQSLKYPGHIVLIGDVNPGAEIIAGGHIIVWGKMRGLAHAGALGDEQAIICALELAPAQLRIAGHFGRPPEGRRRKSLPETAKISDGDIVVEPWFTRE